VADVAKLLPERPILDHRSLTMLIEFAMEQRADLCGAVNAAQHAMR